MTRADALRPPALLETDASAYKDWLHLNVLDHASGAVGLVNASIHGSPADPRSRVVGTALIHVPGEGWIGNVEVAAVGEADIAPTGISLERVAVALDRERDAVLAAADLPDDGLRLNLTATAAAQPFGVELPLPLGHGWISWYVVPRLRLDGQVVVGDETLGLLRASAYHDHNWGRWHWGDDLGWEWGCLLAPAPGPAFVVSRTTDRAHAWASPALLTVDVGGRKQRFSGHAVTLELGGFAPAEPRRVPGALAALHQDRLSPRLPTQLVVGADDGRDWVRVEFAVAASAQLIAADPALSGYGFLHELAGTFDFAFRIRSETSRGSGIGMVEFVV